MFFKLKPSLQLSIEGEREFAFLAVVPKRWRGDVVSIECKGIWENKGLGILSSSFDQCGSKIAYVGLYLAQDDEAKQLAKDLSGPGEALPDRVLALAPSLAALTEEERNRLIYADESLKPLLVSCQEAAEALVSLSQGYCGRGAQRARAGKFEMAMLDFNKALRLDPTDLMPCICLARLYATCPDEKYRDGKKAFEYARKVYRLAEERDWFCADTLAAAYAECGDFEKARKCEADAVHLAPDEECRRAASSRLELYKQEKPYRAKFSKTP